ncbi:MAG: hypothetical protein MUC60_11280 [Oscillatoria sp. Prado101]|jgi:hypothetical protein|nr:hypothetical protein [Oscillatoria sp. Prado101]
MTTFRICGVAIDSEFQGVAGLRVEAWDKDLFCNDLLGAAITDESGHFQIDFDESYFQELFFDRQPDIFFKIFQDGHPIITAEDSVIWNADIGETEIVIQVNITDDSTFQKERQQFKTLLLSNPNYFGNLLDSPYEAVTQITGNTTYEELTCIGFNPDKNLLEATIALKLPSGYGGGLCGAGSTEYVRFFLNYGSGWEDAGVVGVNVHDIPNLLDCAGKLNKPLTYTVTLKIAPKTNWCRKSVLPLVRAVLSWNAVPSTNPNQLPVWGNVLECHIQIKPRKKILIDLIAELSALIGQEIKLPPEYEPVKLIPFPLPDPPPFALADLAKLYGGGNTGITAQTEGKTLVEPHRFGLSDIYTTLALPAFNSQAVPDKIAEWQSLNLNWQEAAAALNNTQANVSYEQLKCLGLDYHLERLVATFRIKRPTGYSGDLCTPGSLEHIAFWADWDNTCQWTYLGTVTVNVHDIANIPAEGLCYSAILPVDLTYHRRPCNLPKIARVRAVLSWAVPPSTTDPDDLKYWGNRLDAHVQIKPGPVIEKVKPILYRIGGIYVDKIDSATGLTAPGATFENGLPADSYDRPCPFADRVVITGPSFPAYKYRIQVRKQSEAIWTTVANTITVQPMFGSAYSKTPVTPDGFFTYETLFQNPDMVLAWWDTAGDEKWEIKLEIEGESEIATQIIQLKNSGVEDVRIHINSGGDCKDFVTGIEINGSFVARDPYFGSFSLYSLPFAAPAGQLNPTGGTVQTAPAPPEPAPPPGGNSWTLNTKDMAPCGYVVKLDVADRAIRNSVPNWHHWASDSVGFCLRQKVQPDQ